MQNSNIAIIGATGKTGARVQSLLNQKGINTRSLSRNAEIPFDWDNKSTWAPALKGVTAAYVTYYPDLAVPQAQEDIRLFVEIAKAQNLQHLVLLSGRGEEGAKRAEDEIVNSGLIWNIVRASWFMQNFSESFMVDGIDNGQLVLPTPKAKEPFIDVDDIAEVAVAALTRQNLHNQLLEVTGPELLTFNNCVDYIGSALGRPVDFMPVPVDAYLANAKAEGLPDDIAWLLNELFVNVLDGRNESTTSTIEKILGRPAKSFRQYVEGAVKAGAWQRGDAISVG